MASTPLSPSSPSPQEDRMAIWGGKWCQQISQGVITSAHDSVWFGAMAEEHQLSPKKPVPQQNDPEGREAPHGLSPGACRDRVTRFIYPASTRGVPQLCRQRKVTFGQSLGFVSRWNHLLPESVLGVPGPCCPEKDGRPGILPPFHCDKTIWPKLWRMSSCPETPHWGKGCRQDRKPKGQMWLWEEAST